MRVTILILSIILFFVGFEAFNVGGLISSLFIYGGYLFVILHIFVILGLYKKIEVARKAFIGENMFFISLIIYYVIVIPKLNFGPSSFSEPTPLISDYMKSLSYGMVPLIFFVVNIIVSFKSSR
jgi:hypothetical protein